MPEVRTPQVPADQPSVHDLLLTNGVIRTFDDRAPWAQSVAVTDGRISYVGPADDAPAARRHIDLNGRLVTPGIIDSHNHLLLGFDSEAVSLEGCTALTDVRARIRQLAASRPDLDWICGENVVYSVVDGRRPNADDLAGVTDRPVFITTYDQHSVWLNRAALRVLGITREDSISWGNPEIDDGTGEPTGWVTDFYTLAMTSAGLRELQKSVPLYSPERRFRKLVNSAEMALRFGITSMVEPQVALDELPLLLRAREQGLLRGRVTAALFHPVGADAAFRAELRAATLAAPPDPFLQLGPVKLYADDVIEPHTAAMLADYANRPGERGRPSYPNGELKAVIGELDRLGFQVHTHATGDAGIRMTLDAIEAAADANGTVDRRHGIVHVECLHPDDLPRFASLGVVAAMQPRHCSPDLVRGTWMDNVGQERWDRAWRFRSLIESGADVAFSSDWQVGEMDPLVGVYSALTRASLDGRETWTPNERLGLDEALFAYTRAGARAWHAEQELGVVRVGAHADLVAFSANLYELADDPTRLLGESVDLTLVAGAAVYESGALGG